MKVHKARGIKQTKPNLLSGLLFVFPVGFAGVASAAPFVDVSVLGSATQNGTYTSSLTVTPGETIYYEVIEQLAPSGTTNSNNSYTLGTQIAGTDGVNSLDLKLGDAADTTLNPVIASSWLGASGTGPDGGGYFVAQAAGTDVGVTPSTIMTGSFTAPSVSSDTVSSGWNTQDTGNPGGSGAIKVLTTSSSKSKIIILSGGSGGSEAPGASDPYVGYAPLTLTDNSLPVSLVWDNAAGTGTWDTVNANWNNSGSTATFRNLSGSGDEVTFGDSNNGSYNVVINGTVTPSLTTFTNSAGNYTISGANASSGISGNHLLYVSGSGTVTISSNNNYSGGTQVNSGTLILASAGAFPAGTSLTDNSVVAFTNHSGGTAWVLKASQLALAGGTNAWTGKVGLANNAMIIQAGGSSLSNTFNQVKQGYNGGNWQGSGGISSSAAAADTKHLTALGVILNDTGSNSGSTTGTALYTSLDGVATSDGDILVKYTYYGDANLSGNVDGSDYSDIDNGFLQKLTGWFNGDFNYDGVVNGSDYTLIDNSFNSQGSSLQDQIAGPSATVTAEIAGSNSASAVPEPASMAVLFMTVPGLLSRRRRNI